MKKAAILCITSFYLLLTTGMFVCLIHCAAEGVTAKHGMNMAARNNHCQKASDCDCCKKHANYIVKENLKPGYTIHFLQAAISISPVYTIGFQINTPADQDHTSLSANNNLSAGEIGPLPRYSISFAPYLIHVKPQIFR